MRAVHVVGGGPAGVMAASSPIFSPGGLFRTFGAIYCTNNSD